MKDNASPSGLPFMKMHGAGNDFVVIDSRLRGPGFPGLTTAALARALGDRHRGVGFDQLAEIRAVGCAAEGNGSPVDVALDFWNSDGSRAGACGNATRCIADFLLAQGHADTLGLHTDRGRLAARRGPDGMVSVNMGLPQLAWADVPLAQDADLLHLPLPGDPAAVGMGNPHCVFFVPDAGAVDPALRGPGIASDPLFPEGVNVEFVSVIGPDRLRMRVWERGAGVTLACGSGACAAAVAAHRRGLTGRSVVIELDGGTLVIDWRDDGVWMTGPTAHVFDGWLTPDFLARHR